jgi:serine protease Do
MGRRLATLMGERRSPMGWRSIRKVLGRRPWSNLGNPAIAALLASALVGTSPAPARGEGVAQVFQRVNKTVVIVRAKGRDLTVQSGNSVLVKFNEVGSGVLVSPDGKVLTAAHVVQIADEITVEFVGGETVPARVVASEPRADLAMLQLERVPAGAQVAVLGDSSQVQVGEQVFIVGAPYGIAHTLTVGYVSARHRPNTIYAELPLAEFLQTDAAINQGNSGGPMFSLQGDVIGIVSHIISKSGGFEGLGFVVSSNMARQLMLDQRPFWSGVTWFKVSGDLAEYFNLPQPFGLLVEEVAKRSPAEAAGLRPSRAVARLEGRDLPLGGDIVLAAMGIKLEDERSFEKVREAWRRLRPGDEMTFTVLRAGRVLDLKGRMP